jgi:hypothetical protein
VRFGGVRVEGIFGAGSLILRPMAFLPTTFLALEGGEAVITLTLRLSARVFEASALEPPDEASTELALGVRTEIGIVGIGNSLSKPGT